MFLVNLYGFLEGFMKKLSPLNNGLVFKWIELFKVLRAILFKTLYEQYPKDFSSCSTRNSFLEFRFTPLKKKTSLSFFK